MSGGARAWATRCGSSPTPSVRPLPAQLARLQADLAAACGSRPATIDAARQWLDRLEADVADVLATLAAVSSASAGTPAPGGDTGFWVDALARQCRSVRDELAFLAPWSDAGDRTRRIRRAGKRPCDSDPARARGARGAVAAGRCEPSRHRADGADRAAGAAMRGAVPHGVRLPLRQGAPPARHRVQRRGAQARCELLRPARVGGAVRQLRGDLAGGGPAGELVRARPPPHHRGGPIGAPVLERLDVRVPDAAPGDAHIRQHAARPVLSRDGGPADRLREAARRALGHLGMRLQLGRREPQLPVPRLRRARAGVEARSRGGPGHRALRLGARVDGGSRGVVPQPAAARRRRARRTLRPVRGDRLHARAAAARAGERRRALVHGASPGHDPALAGACAARPSDAEALRVGSAVQGDPPAAAGTHTEGRGVLLASGRAFRDSRDIRRRGSAGARDPEPRHGHAGSAAPFERQVSRHGHQRGRGKQPLEGPRGHPLARGRHPRPLGHVLLHPRRGERRVLVGRAPADAQAPDALRGDIHRSARRIPPRRRRLRMPYRDRRLARKTTSSCAGCASPTARAPGARSTSRATRRSRSRRRRPTRCIRRFPTSSCRRRSSRPGKPSSARAVPDRCRSSRRGCST